MSNIEISGAKILVRFGSVVITETVVNTWLIMLVIFIACRILTRGLTVRGGTKRQMVAEWIVTKVNGLVKTNMGEAFRDYPPLIAAIMALSALCRLSSMVGLYAPTSDLSTLVGWSLMVFVLITYYKIRANGFLGYLKGYTEPIVVMLPMNVVSEIATPISMAFRHFGNVASGTVVTALVYAALSALSAAVFKFLPGALASIPFFQVGLPAVLSLYFDIFSSCIQAFIFSMLTMAYVSAAAQ